MSRNILSKVPGWIVAVACLALLLGLLLVSAWRMGKPDADGQSIDQLRARTSTSGPDIGKPIEELKAEIKRLRIQVTEAEEAMADQSRQASVLNDNLQQVKFFAGLNEVQGPGIEITLSDSDKGPDDLFILQEFIIHDTDILRVVNELWMSGAEVISVNKQRVSTNTSFRCEGPVVYVGRVPTSSPVTIRAIGDADTLYGGVMMPGRYLDMIISADPDMVSVTKHEKLVLPAYTGSTEFRYAELVTPEE